MISLYFILASLFLTLVTAQSIDSCTDQNTCNECIQTRGCAWCLKLISGLDDSPRCHSMVSIDQICVKSFIENPRNASIVSENRKLTQGRAKPGEKIVQIYPQRMNLKLRISEFCFVIFSVSYKKLQLMHHRPTTKDSSNVFESRGLSC